MTASETGASAFGKRAAARSPSAPAGGARIRLLWPVALAVLVAELLLQWFPVTGVFLMLLGAPLWSMVLVNLVLILFALDAWRAAMPRWLVAVPAAVYLANFAASAVSYLDYAALAADAARQNAAQSLSYDPAREVLVTADGDGQDLVLDYRIPVVFTPNPNAAPASHLSVRAAPKPVCEEIGGASVVGPVQVLGAVTRGRSYDNLCLLRMFEDPALPAVTLSSSEQTSASADRLLKYQMTTFRAVGPDGQVASRRIGVGAVLSPIPAPVIGCVLNDAANRWQCVAELLRLPVGIGRQGGATSDSTADAIATLLGLQPRSLTVVQPPRFLVGAVVHADPREFDSASEAQALSIANNLLKAQTQADLDALPAYLAGDNASTDPALATTVARHADQVAALADRMSTAYEQAVDGDHSNRIYTLGTILAALPADAFARVGPRLLQVAQGQSADQWAPETLIVRFGDLAPASADYLRRQLVAVRDPMAVEGAVLGLCRAGPVMQADGPGIVAAVSRIRGPTRQAAFIALRRMGRYDLAQRLAGRPSAYDHALFEGEAAHVTPASPRTVCRVEGRLANNLPDAAWLR
jgi:hypothetical protein